MIKDSCKKKRNCCLIQYGTKESGRFDPSSRHSRIKISHEISLKLRFQYLELEKRNHESPLSDQLAVELNNSKRENVRMQ